MKLQISTFMRWTSRVVMLTTFALVVPQQSAYAGLVRTDQVLAHEQAAPERARISAFLARADVLAQLQSLGVTPGEAKARVYALTDEEAHQLAGKLDQFPAGGDILSLLFTVFVILLITDILGFTKVFTFTRPIKR
ncbi:MAG: PA2779 family protein [Gallionella sp.]